LQQTVEGRNSLCGKINCGLQFTLPDFLFSNCSDFFLDNGDYISIILNMSNNQTDNLQRLAEMFKALGNPHRLAVFLRLASCCPPGAVAVSEYEARRFVGQLGAELDIAASTLSHHIKELRQAGLIRMERKGKNIECWIDGEALSTITDLLTGLSSASPSEAQVACGADCVAPESCDCSPAR
jgi:DNA-binding transcriptional ArsR family regulator